MTRPAMLWPVYGLSDYFRREYIATFFNWGDAVSFVNAHLKDRSLYIAEPEYDRRLLGYGVAAEPAAAPVLDLTVERLGDGCHRVAA